MMFQYKEKNIFKLYIVLYPEVMWKLHNGNQDFFPIPMGGRIY